MYTKQEQLRSKSKYANKKQTYKGNSYHSQAEANRAWELDQLKKAKKIKDWKRQVKIELKGENGKKICNYFMDFVVEHNDGVEEFLEVKGFQTALWKMKWKLLEDKYGKDSTKKLTIEWV